MRKALLILALSCGSLVAWGQADFDQWQNLGDAVNTPYDEQHLVMSADGTEMFFSRTGDPSNAGGQRDKGDIWHSQKVDGAWTPAKPLPKPINTVQLNAPAGLSANGDTLYLVGTYPKGSGHLVPRGLSYTVRRADGSWERPVPFSIRYFQDSGPEPSAWVGPQGKVAILSMDRPGGYGAEDLYVCFRTGPLTWSAPENLGPTINTARQEMYPYMPSYGLLLFSSNGHPGQGSKDIYRSQRGEDWTSWSAPAGLQANSRGTETSVAWFPNQELAYQISTQNSRGFGDVLYYTPEEDLDLKEDSLVLPEVPEPPAPAAEPAWRPAAWSVQLRSAVDSSAVAEGMLRLVPPAGQERVIRDQGGSLDLTLDEPGEYGVFVKAENYMDVRDTLWIEADQSGAQLAATYYLRPLRTGERFSLPNVLFRRGTAQLVPGSTATLSDLVVLMQEYPNMKVAIEGHTEARGDYNANVELSEARAQEVKDYLVRNGIDQGRITSQGFGPDRPLAPNDTEEGRRLNRRVEFVVVEF